MDKEALVDRDIDAGRRLVQALDQAGFPIVAALWTVSPEDSDWRLLISSPKVNEAGPRATYAAIQEVLRRSKIELHLYCISAVGPDDPLITELRIFAGTEPAPFIGGTCLQRVVIGDAYVEGAYIYRAERIVGKSGTFEHWLVTPDKSRKVWTARRCRIAFEDGFFRGIEVEGGDWPRTHSKAGINTYLTLLANPEERDTETIGDVQRWSIREGRLRSVENIASGVKIEGYSASPSSAGV